MEVTILVEVIKTVERIVTRMTLLGRAVTPTIEGEILSVTVLVDTADRVEGILVKASVERTVFIVVEFTHLVFSVVLAKTIG